MNESFPLPLLRIWCRKKDAWLSFRTLARDHYFINPNGYFVELPDATLASITSRVAFPVVNCYPCLVVGDLDLQEGYSPPSHFVFAPRDGSVTGKPEPIRLSELRHELDQILPCADTLSPPEKYIALRVLESGQLDEEQLTAIIQSLSGGKRTLGQHLVATDVLSWEMLMGVCMDTRVPGKLDPPSMRRASFLREWEMAGEVLIALGKATRTQLEYALKIKREGSRSLGEILTTLGACSNQDIEQCLVIQSAIREVQGPEVGMIGELLVQRGAISQNDLDEAMQRQRVGSQSLERILLALGACTSSDIEEFRYKNNWHNFQGEIDDYSLGNWLLYNRRIKEEHLKQALGIQNRGRQFIGDILVAMGLCTAEDVKDSVSLQKDVREAHRAGMEKLGSLLMSKGKIEEKHLEEAMGLQDKGRLHTGQILMAVAGCTEADIKLALTLQTQWREKMSLEEDDRLGEVLIRRGFITEESLQKALAAHINSGKPIGRVLVEEEICTPEEIVATLMLRDYKRQCDLLAFIRKGVQARQMPPVPTLSPATPAKKPAKSVTERLLSVLLPKFSSNS